jgi:hypothetical protein
LPVNRGWYTSRILPTLVQYVCGSGVLQRERAGRRSGLARRVRTVGFHYSEVVRNPEVGP